MQSIGSKRKGAEPAAAVAASMGVCRKTGKGMMGMPSPDEPDDEAMEAAEAAAAAATSTTVGGRKVSMPRIRVGNRHLTMHSELIEMTDSTPLFAANDFVALRDRLETQGFLFVRGVIPPATVKAARMKMLAHLRDKGAIRDNTEWEQGFIEYQAVWDAKQRAIKADGGAAHKRKKHKGAAADASTACTGMMGMAAAACPPAAATAASASSGSKKMIPGWTVDAESGGLVGGREADDAIAGWHAIGNSRELRDIYNGAAVRSFYQRLFENDKEYTERPQLAAQGALPYTTLPSCTWLRAKGPGEVTAEHADYYYFYKNTSIFSDYFTKTPEDAEKERLAKVANKQTRELTDDEKETCQICHDPKDPESTLICDLCNHGYHTTCLRPRVAELPGEEQEWHCHGCTNAALNYWTCWTALGDIAGLDGRLALVAGSHRLGGYEHPAREDLLPRDYTRSFEQGSVWQTPTEIRMGDIILFNIKTIHAATRNGGEKFRLSLDTRITTCKGAKYLQDNKIDSIDAPAPVQLPKAKAKASQVVPAIGAQDGTIAAHFANTKKKVTA